MSDSLVDFSSHHTISFNPRSGKYRNRNIKTCITGVLFVLILQNFVATLKLYLTRDRKLPYFFCLAQTGFFLCAWFVTAGHSIFGDIWDCRDALYADLFFISGSLACINVVLLLKANSIRVAAAATKETTRLPMMGIRGRYFSRHTLQDGRWIWPVGLLLIAIPTALRLFAMSFLPELDPENHCYLPIPSNLWSICTLIADLMCNIFLTACFLWKIRSFIRDQRPLAVMHTIYREGWIHAMAIIICSTTCAILAKIHPTFNVVFYAIDRT
ncbi:hypothetical protein SYNPS1DRAFT_22031 [Syncephalis pseudoplumigaleata]|uniref:Uncharacterized protein n=1 Tax=Syncephalis pseudoplumigaleata TaxID=1712513 RepID=A0A4P9Z3N8_9FUNG|nr:hypothetical protein SYNPS1DRAFT_22031 [Syncephalis pseudoplumigaleata]|eukprot:RKP26140.1 hypothetical protein SYNPS1DRAFT_22031 [Syncephalis pseudoplumigaleata]